jgi:hypothetical protein
MEMHTYKRVANRGIIVIHPTDVVKETWRVQASDNVDTHDMLCAVDELTVESTVDAMITELVDFEAVIAL